MLIVGTIRRPAVAFAGVLCLYGLKQWGQNTSALLVQYRMATNLIVGALVLAAVAILTFGDRTRFDYRMPTNWKLAVTLYVYAFMTLVLAPDLDASLKLWALQWPYIVTFVLFLPLVLNSMADVRTALSAAVLVGGAICALALFAGNWGPRGLIILGDIYEQQTNPLAIASLGGTVFLGALFLMRMPQPWWRRILLAALIPIGIAVIFRSQSRGQLGAAALAAAIGWLFASRKAIGTKVFSLAVTGVLVGSIGWWVFDQLQVDAQRFSGALAENDAEGRLQMARTLLGEAARSPLSLIFGLGNSSSYHYLGIYPHITALEVLAEEGLLGFMLYAAFIVTTLASAARLFGAMNDHSSSGDRVAAAAVMSLFMFELMLSMKQGTYLSSTYVIAYATVIARMANWQAGGDTAVAQEPLAQKPVPLYSNLMR
jgi:O-antigen ligase